MVVKRAHERVCLQLSTKPIICEHCLNAPILLFNSYPVGYSPKNQMTWQSRLVPSTSQIYTLLGKLQTGLIGIAACLRTL